METTHSKFTLKRATLIAAIGTTAYTFFVPVCRILFGQNAVWFNYAEHPWCCDVWHTFFSCVLMVSWAVLALGIIRDGEHFPALGKGFRYALLVFAIAFSVYILCSHSFAFYQGRRVVCAAPWLFLLFPVVCSAVLWYLYAHTDTTQRPRIPRWQKGVCWAVVVLTLLVVAKQTVAAMWYVWRAIQHCRLVSVPVFREVHYNAVWICNWLMCCIPLVFFLLIFLQPISIRRAPIIKFFRRLARFIRDSV